MQRRHKSIFERSGQPRRHGRTQDGKPGATGAFGSGSTSHRGSGVSINNPNDRHAEEGSPVKPAIFNKVCQLRVHEETFSSSDLVMNPSFFPGIKVGDVVAIKPIAVDPEEPSTPSQRATVDTDTAQQANDAGPSNKGKDTAEAVSSSIQTPIGDDASSSKGTDKREQNGQGPDTGNDRNLSRSGNTSTKSTGTNDSGGSAITATITTAAMAPEAVSAPATNNEAAINADQKSNDGVSNVSRATSLVDIIRNRVDAGTGTQPRRDTNATRPPKGPNRWKGMMDSDTELLRDRARCDDDNDDEILKPDPHREIFVQVGEVKRDAQQLQASILTPVARAMWNSYQTNQKAMVRKINMDNPVDCESIRADFVEITFRDQYVGRSDMWRLWLRLRLKVVHNNKPTNMEGLIRATVRRIYKDGKQVPCGFIDTSTQPIFRSESGRFIIFIQMSEEIWSYQEDGNLCFEKAVNHFLADLFQRWTEMQLNHMVTIVMFSRWYYHVRDSFFFQDLAEDENNGRYYRDYYKVIADMEVRSDWTAFLPDILAEFNNYRRDIQELNTSYGYRLRGDLSKANQGNILEAINLGINSFASNYVDRDLLRTGLSIIVVTPSFGIFDVSKKLLRVTTERMLYHGIRADFVCLAHRPLFRPPVFRFKSLVVPTEQEHRQAMLRKQEREMEAQRFRDNELPANSPKGESPGSTAGLQSGVSFAGWGKERIPKMSSILKLDAAEIVDPLVFDSLYFDDEAWERDFLPYLQRNQDQNAFYRPEARENQKGLESDSHEPVVNKLLKGCQIDTKPIDSIIGITSDDYPFFSSLDANKKPQKKITYCYFPYWVDCGFYNYSDARVARQPTDFHPSCKMGDVSITGITEYMKKAPTIPDLNLYLSDDELTALFSSDQSGSCASDVSGNDIGRSRSDSGQQQKVSLSTKDASIKHYSHGHILSLDKVSLQEKHEYLQCLFDKFDREIMAGCKTNSSPEGHIHYNDLPVGSSSSVGIAEISSATVGATAPISAAAGSDIYLSGFKRAATENDNIHLVQSSLVQFSHDNRDPSVLSASSENNQKRGDTERTSRIDIDSSDSRGYRSASAGREGPSISVSASPSDRSAHGIQIAQRTEHDTTISSSVPREIRLGAYMSGQANRTSIFIRGGNQRRRTQQNQQARFRSSPESSGQMHRHQSRISSRIASEHPEALKRNSSIAKSNTNDFSEASQSNRHVSISDVQGGGYSVSGNRSGVSRASGGSPGLLSHALGSHTSRQNQLSYSKTSIVDQKEATLFGQGKTKQIEQRQNKGTDNAISGSDRAAVSESIAKQSHLDGHIQTFHGTPKRQQKSQQQHQQLLGDSETGMPNYVSSKQNTVQLNTQSSEDNFYISLPVGSRQSQAGHTVAVHPESSTGVNDSQDSPPRYARTGFSSDPHLMGGTLSTRSPRGLRGRGPSSYNPCNPDLNPLPQTALSQRWTFAFPTQASLSSETSKWKSLCTPASLPLVTDFFSGDLENFYKQYSYHVDTPVIGVNSAADLPREDSDDYINEIFHYPRLPGNHDTAATSRIPIKDRVIRIMLKEMIYQRLAQGFQFISAKDAPVNKKWERGTWLVPVTNFGQTGLRHKFGLRSESERLDFNRISNESYFGVSSAMVPSSVSMPPSGNGKRLGYEVWLTNGRQFQHLEYQESNNASHVPGIIVTRWERNKPFDQDPIKYNFLVWSRNDSMGYRRSQVQFTYPQEDEVNWNNLDYLIVGYQNQLTTSLKYWRARYVLIPNDQLGNDTIISSKNSQDLSIEDMRIANFEKFLDQILRLLRKDEKADLEQRFLGALPPEMVESMSALAPHWSPPGAQSPPQPSGSGTQPHQKTISIRDIAPSSLMQIRYTSLYPVSYLSHQLYCHMNDKIYLDPNLPITLPPPTVRTLNWEEPLTPESPVSTLAYALQHPAVGVKLRNIRWHFSYHENIFTGYQLVDWMLVNFDNITKRPQAIAAGNQMLERDIFRHVSGKKPFIDGYQFYEFTDLARSYRVNGNPALSKVPQSIIASIGLSDVIGRYSSGSNTASPINSRPTSRQDSTTVPTSTEGEQKQKQQKQQQYDQQQKQQQQYRNDEAGNIRTGTIHLSSTESGSNTVSSNRVAIAEASQPLNIMRSDTSQSLVAPGNVAASVSSARHGAGPGNTAADDSAHTTNKQLHTEDIAKTEFEPHPAGTENQTLTTSSGNKNVKEEMKPQTLSNTQVQHNRNQQLQPHREEDEEAGINQTNTPDAAEIKDKQFRNISKGYHWTPDVFPNISRKNSRRHLPKKLYQSRMFALDLDKQRKSSRTEHCLVHLDAVQNPMTCFHLSINWLNCTNHLIYELVQGWARMAERCGMRLAEAPRAQDTVPEENHPFHSPIRITLSVPPPQIEQIFDDEWVSQFVFLDENDEGNDTESDYSTGDEDNGEGTINKARVMRRMSKCLPKFTFERELLEEHDFVLDVEAEANYPSEDLLRREYTFERRPHKFTQYVHRSGTAFVQICGPGQFLWINNYLFTSRQSHPRTQGNNIGTGPVSANSQMGINTYSGRGESSAALTAAAVVAADMGSTSSSSGMRLSRTQFAGSNIRPGSPKLLRSDRQHGAHRTANLAPGKDQMEVQQACSQPRRRNQLWPHQICKPSAPRSARKRNEISDKHYMQMTNDLGSLPTDFETINTAMTRRILSQTDTNRNDSGDGTGIKDNGEDDIVIQDAATHDLDANASNSSLVDIDTTVPICSTGTTPGSSTPPHMSGQGDPSPDILRANFMEICQDRNTLEMFWQMTIERYRNGWRNHLAGKTLVKESSKNKPMVTDVFTEGIWQSNRHYQQQ